MPGLLPDIDPDGLLEFSVVYTDRALNHMSKRFTGVMQDILATLKEVYHAHTAVLVPGSGTAVWAWYTCLSVARMSCMTPVTRLDMWLSARSV